MKNNVLKIMYLVDAFENPFAGTEGQLRMLIKGLDRTKFDPYMALLRSTKYIEENKFPCPVYTLGINSLASFKSIRNMNEFADKLKREGFNIVHIFFNDSSVIAPLFLKLRSIKVIVSRRDMGYWYTAPLLAILRMNSFLIDHVIVNSNAVKNITVKKEWVSPNKISVIYNGYEDDDSLDMTEREELFLKKINNDDPILGLVANIRPIKRIEDVIKALPKILKFFPNAKFVHVGGGDETELLKLAKDLNVLDAVVFLGQQEKPKEYMFHFDVAILCSESEGFSNAIIEYMKCHNPVVCTDVGGNSEIVVHGKTGYLVNVGDTEDLANKVISLFSDSALSKEYSDAGYMIAKNEFSKEKMIERHEYIYKKTILLD